MWSLLHCDTYMTRFAKRGLSYAFSLSDLMRHMINCLDYIKLKYNETLDDSKKFQF